MSIAETILAQLGGNKFIAMTGARGFVETAHGRGLWFRLPRKAKDGINVVTITLDASDTYSLRFASFSTRTLQTTEIDETHGVFVGNLRDTFEQRTHLYTSI